MELSHKLLAMMRINFTLHNGSHHTSFRHSPQQSKEIIIHNHQKNSILDEVSPGTTNSILQTKPRIN